MMMQQAVIESKAGVQQQVSALIELVEAGVGSGEAAHIMERSLFQQLLKVSGSRVTLPPPGPLRTVQASLPAHGSSLDKAP